MIAQQGLPRSGVLRQELKPLSPDSAAPRRLSALKSPQKDALGAVSEAGTSEECQGTVPRNGPLVSEKTQRGRALSMSSLGLFPAKALSPGLVPAATAMPAPLQ